MLLQSKCVIPHGFHETHCAVRPKERMTIKSSRTSDFPLVDRNMENTKTTGFGILMMESSLLTLIVSLHPLQLLDERIFQTKQYKLIKSGTHLHLLNDFHHGKVFPSAMSLLTFEGLSGAAPISKSVSGSVPRPGATWSFDSSQPTFSKLGNLSGNFVPSALQVSTHINPTSVERILAHPPSTTPYTSDPDTHSRATGNNQKGFNHIQLSDPQFLERHLQDTKAEPQSEQVYSLHNNTSNSTSPSNSSINPKLQLVDVSSSSTLPKQDQKQSSSGNTRSEVPSNDPGPYQLENVSSSSNKSQMATSPTIGKSSPSASPKELVVSQALKQALGPLTSTLPAIPFSTLPHKETRNVTPTNTPSRVNVVTDGADNKTEVKLGTPAQKTADGVIGLKPLGAQAVVADGLKGSPSASIDFNKIYQIAGVQHSGVVADGIKGDPSLSKTSQKSNPLPTPPPTKNSTTPAVKHIKGAPKNATSKAIPKSSNIFTTSKSNNPTPDRILGIDKKLFLFTSGIIGACLMAALIGFLVQCSKGTKRRKEDKTLEDDPADFLQGNSAPWIDHKPPTPVQVFKPVASLKGRRSDHFYEKPSGYGQRGYIDEADPYEHDLHMTQSYGPRSFPVTAYDDVASEVYYPPQKGYLDHGDLRDSASINIKYYEDHQSPNQWDRHRTSGYQTGPLVGIRGRQAPGTPTDFYESSLGNRPPDDYRMDKQRMDERHLPDHRRFEDSQSHTGSSHLYSPTADEQPRIQLRPPAAVVRYDDIFPTGGNKSIGQRSRERQEARDQYDSRATANSFYLSTYPQADQDSRPRNQTRLHDAVEDFHRNLAKPTY
ncbi:hypothetical protein DFH28DRAFT_1222126 [Melampsora americana]|nr:hypothetical protein DFH28DRAFT_1222126 [Melampsora americana]